MNLYPNLQGIKETAKKIPLIMNTYLVYMVFRRMRLRDIFNLGKLALFWKVAPYTMVTYGRLSQVYELTRMFEEKKIAGAFIECGVWRGGCVAIMAYVADKAKSNRKTWLFDSFEGLPEPIEKDGPSAARYARGKASGQMAPIGQVVASLEYVKFLLFTKLKLNEENICIEKGWFQNTLPACREKIGNIAILRLDGDWYESTKCCLENLYQNVIKGGYVIIDDYDNWEGAQRAVDEFVTAHGINVELRKIDYGGRYFQRP